MILTKSKYKSSFWSGGTTTELFIYPHESSYLERNFQVRISSATVDIEESNFTKLPDYNRVLMILDGELEIKHQGKYNRKLSQYECDYFDGAWDTSAKGKVIDFNLMTSKSLQGEIKYHKLITHAKFTLNPLLNHKLIGVYLISGSLINLKDKQLVKQGDLIILQKQDDMYELQALEESTIIYISVS